MACARGRVDLYQQLLDEGAQCFIPAKVNQRGMLMGAVENHFISQNNSTVLHQACTGASGEQLLAMVLGHEGAMQRLNEMDAVSTVSSQPAEHL